MAGLTLSLRLNLGDKSLDGMLAVHRVPVVHGLGTHVLAQIASVSRQAGEDEADVVVNDVHLFLVLGKRVGSSLESDEHLPNFWLTIDPGQAELLILTTCVFDLSPILV